MNNIAGNIKSPRKEKGLSQEQMAERLHVTRQTVSAWERGVAQPGLDILGEIAKALEYRSHGGTADPLALMALVGDAARYTQFCLQKYCLDAAGRRLCQTEQAYEEEAQ